MTRMLNNIDYRNMLVKLACVMAAAGIALFALLYLQLHGVKSAAAQQSAAIVGRVLALHPELEDDVVRAVTQTSSEEERLRGAQALARYGYSAETPLDADPVLLRMVPGLAVSMLGFLAALTAALLLLQRQGYRRVYRRVRAVADAAERVIDGDFSARLPGDAEGEFEILGHRFNQMANRLKLGMEQLQAEKIFLKNIISDISHQLKTPLSTLVVYTDILANEPAMEAAQRQNFVDMERQQLQRLEWLIQSLLKMARLEAGAIVFRREQISLQEVARSATAALAAAAGEAHVTICVQEGNASIVGDGEWLCEALINIIKNGVEHSKPGGAVRVSLEESPLLATISVADSGEGIDAKDLPHIFERFYRSSRSLKPNSVGIGLALSKAIVEGQGGSIAVRSEPGRGSEFVITFLKEG